VTLLASINFTEEAANTANEMLENIVLQASTEIRKSASKLLL